MFVIKQGDRLPSLEATIRRRSDGSAVDLTAALGVTFRMWKQRVVGGSYKVNAAAVMVTPSAGVVRYDWTSLDTDDAGDYLGEFVVSWPSSKTQTIPTDGAFHVRVLDGGLPG